VFVRKVISFTKRSYFHAVVHFLLLFRDKTVGKLRP
jgi:hypothetical protein